MADGGTAPPALDIELHDKQAAAFMSPATEILYGGAAGGGKSHLMRVLAIAICTDVPGVQVYLFRRLSDDIFKNHMAGPGGFFELLGPWLATGYCKFNSGKNFLEFWNKSRIWLCHCQYEKDVAKYQGAEIHVLLIDELTHFSQTIYRALRARCRLGALQVPERWKNRLPLIVGGSNPGGIGHNWVKNTWINPKPALEIWRTVKEEGGMLRQFIPAKLTDNPTMENDPDYADRLSGLGSRALVEAMLNGDWDIVAGGALDDVWTPRIIIPRFQVPRSWYVDRSFDWGSTKPFSVLWWAQSDGTEAVIRYSNGLRRKFVAPKDSLIMINEWYGAKGPNEGLRMPAFDIGQGIVEREKELAKDWVLGPLHPGPADNSIDATIDPGEPTIAAKMKKAGISWRPSNKNPGSRKTGLDLMRAMLGEANKDHPEQPAMYIMDHCRNAIAHFPVLPRDPGNEDDVDSGAEDHDYDSARYRVLYKRTTATVQELNSYRR